MPLAAFPKCFLDHLCVAKSMSPDQWVDLVDAELEVDGLEFYWGFTPQDGAAIPAAVASSASGYTSIATRL